MILKLHINCNSLSYQLLYKKTENFKERRIMLKELTPCG